MKSLLLAFLLFCVIISTAQQPGTLDPTFGKQGLVISSPGLFNLGETIVVTKEGRILIGTVAPYKGFAYTFKIDALLPSGSIDSSFGVNGSAFILFSSMTKASNTASIASLALLKDGRILISGNLDASGSNDDIALAQLKLDGSLDSSFGTNGTATASFGYFAEGAVALTIQSDGKFLIGGSVIINVNNYTEQFYTARFLPNGTKDLSYGSKGFVLGSVNAGATAIALQNDGKIVAAGFSGAYSANLAHFHIERYNEDGSYDKSFDNDGILNTQIGNGSCIINDALITDDNQIIVTGSSNGIFNSKLTTVRYNSDGSLDKSFDDDGIVITEFSQYAGVAKKVILTGEMKDKIVVAGNNNDNISGKSDFALASYYLNGSPDTEFGSNGVQITHIGDGNYVNTAAVQPDGKIVAIGYTQSFETFEINRSLARYFGYPTKVPLAVRIKRFIHNHGIIWNGLPADDNIAYYSVEQSSLSTKGFTPIAKLSGRSNLHDYSISNNSLLKGTNYYRVKAVSTDGTIRYSEVVSADNIANTASIFPNPAKSYVTVQGLATNATANISIKDGSGTILTRGTSSGSTQYRSQVSNLLPGKYYLNITTAGKTETLPFVKE